MERSVAEIILYAKSLEVKAIMYLDSIAHSSIDGEWLFIIVTIFNWDRIIPTESTVFCLRGRATYYRIICRDIIPVGYDFKCDLAKPKCSTFNSSFWEKIDALMTDAVTKNLSIEDTTSNLLKSAYKPTTYYIKAILGKQLTSQA